MMDEETLDRRLGRLSEIMGRRPYAVNIVSLAENPFRETQLAWIKKQRHVLPLSRVAISHP